MTAVSFDAHDPHSLGQFWADALQWDLRLDRDGDIIVEPPVGSPDRGLVPELSFFTVPEGKTTKNRLHLDLRPEDQAAEVTRLQALGARQVSVGQGPDVTWVVMVDPEGNEFCVL